MNTEIKSCPGRRLRAARGVCVPAALALLLVLPMNLYAQPRVGAAKPSEPTQAAQSVKSVVSAVSTANASEAATPDQADGSAGTTDDDSVVLNFEGADIREVIYSLASALNINYWLDPRVQGQVTVRTATPIGREDLMPVFQHILRNNGFVAVNDGKMYVISPAEEGKTRAKLKNSDVIVKPGDDEMIMELVKVHHASAQDIVQLMQTFVTPGGDVLAYPRSNLIIISDLESNAKRLAELVETFDTDTFGDLTAKIYHIEHASIDEIGSELTSVLDSYQALQSGSGVYMIPLPRLNSIAVIAADPEVFVNVEYWLATLDVPSRSTTTRKVHVYHVENAKAADLAGVLNDVFADQGATVSAGGGRGRSSAAAQAGLGLGGGFGRAGGGTGGGTGGFGSQRGTGGFGSQRGAGGFGSQGGAGGFGNQRAGGQRGRGAGRAGRAGRGRSGGAAGVVGQPGALFEQEVNIVPDEVSNSLVILATARDYEQVLSVLHKIDIVPRQVLIEVLLAEITLSNDSTLATEQRLIANDGSTSNADAAAAVVDGGGTFFDVFGEEIRLTGSTAGGLVGVFTKFRDGRSVYEAVLTALASRSRVKLLSRPHLLTADNQEASLVVGTQVPIITTQSNANQQVGGSTNILQNIQYRDTGIILRVLPQVNSEGLVNMHLRQEVSEIAAGVTIQGIDSPAFTTRETESTVVVQNGETIVIAGIIQENKNTTRSGIPYLMDVPVLGQLFKRDSETTRRTELVALITPYVVRDREEAQSVTEEFKRRVDNVLTEIGPDIDTGESRHTFIMH